MPLFSKDNNGHGDDDARRRRSDDIGEQSAAPPPDEHTRLLPNRLDSNRGLLRSDDPAVTPYNLWTVRILRYVTILLALVTFVWWVLLLVSAFATPPGFHARGSGFFAFGFATFSMANVVLTLLFFGVPAKSVRILAIVTGVSPHHVDLLLYQHVLTTPGNTTT
jgi:phage shock protein PspC (stress-responsive transcriptional regulator)